MPTSGLTSAPSELGTFLSTFEQSRRKLREMEAEAAAASGGGQDRYMESERSKQLRQLRDSVSSCRMQLAELEREVENTAAGGGSSSRLGSPLDGLPPVGAAAGAGSGPSPDEKAYVRRVLDVNNRDFSVDGEVVDFDDPEGGGMDAGDSYPNEYRDDPRRARSGWNPRSGGGAWNHRADLREVAARSAAADEMSALRADRTNGARGDGSVRSDNSIDIVEEGDIIEHSRFDDSHEEWDSAVNDFADRAWGYARNKRLRRYGRYCAYVVATVGAIVLLGGLVSKGAKSASASGAVNGNGNGNVDVGSGHKRLDDIRNRIIQSGVTEEKFLTLTRGEPAPPQYRALHWIVEHDAMGLDSDDPFLLQRYALAAFHYSSGDAKNGGGDGDGGGASSGTGRDKTNWLTMRGVCAWRGVQCHHRPGTPPESTTYDDNGGVTHLEMPRRGVGGPLIPEIFRALTDLRILDLSENALTGTLGTEIGRLAQLENLKLGKNEIEGDIPSEVGALAALQDLDLSENLLGGSIPSEIGGLTELVGLGLFGNVLSGSIPTALGEMTKLQVLYLDSNELTGVIPENFYTLGELYDVRLRDNHLTGTVALAIGDMSKLKLLYLDSNDLSGSIPTHIGMLGQLTQLHLFKNWLNGTLPHEVGGLRVLEHFSVNDNALTGSIPEHLSSMQKVRDLYLYGNRLTGTIPPELGGDKDGHVEDFGMAAIADLRLFDNQLRGTIPSRLGNLVHLEHLSLENNKFTGVVPSELGNLANLGKLRLDGNKLSGSVPPEVCHLTGDTNTDGNNEGGVGVLVEFISDCGGDEPLVECSCCTQCVEHGSGR